MIILKTKQWIGQRAGVVAGVILFLAIVLYALAFIIEKGFEGLSTGVVLAAVATALLLAAVSVTIEQYIKANLSDQEVNNALKYRELGIINIDERSYERSVDLGPPLDIINTCHSEILVIGYAVDNFVEFNEQSIAEALEKDKYVGLLILHPAQLEQAFETENRDFKGNIDRTLSVCRNIKSQKPDKADHLIVRGYRGHFYFTGIFVDRYILHKPKSALTPGLIRIQLKANFKSQHEGLVLTFHPQLTYATYYEESCRELWDHSEELRIAAYLSI